MRGPDDGLDRQPRFMGPAGRLAHQTGFIDILGIGASGYLCLSVIAGLIMRQMIRTMDAPSRQPVMLLCAMAVIAVTVVWLGVVAGIAWVTEPPDVGVYGGL